MSRVRKEAKILKNYYREERWKKCYCGTIEVSVARYRLSRIQLAHERLVKACKRRYLNEARRAKRNSDLYKLSIHNAYSPYIADDAYDVQSSFTLFLTIYLP